MYGSESVQKKKTCPSVHLLARVIGKNTKRFWIEYDIWGLLQNVVEGIEVNFKRIVPIYLQTWRSAQKSFTPYPHNLKHYATNRELAGSVPDVVVKNLSLL